MDTSTISIGKEKAVKKGTALGKARAAFSKHKKQLDKLKPYLFLLPAIAMIIFWH